VVVSLWRNKPHADDWALLPQTVAMASMRGLLHVFGILANRGLISPQEIDDSFDGVLRDLAQLPEEARVKFSDVILSTLADLKAVAAANWKGE
jgi:hypothetical protein